MEMFFRILKKDLKRKKTINIILWMFIVLATMFLASSVNNLLAVSGAVDYFMEISKVPDYFAIALSERKEDAIADYLADNPYLAEHEVLDTIVVTDNAQIRILECAEKPGKSRYEKSGTLCISAVPENYMKVFTDDNRPFRLKKGELAIEKVEAEKNNLQVGDKVSVQVGEITKEFRIAEIAKDAVFGSSMMGSKRMFLSKEDFAEYAKETPVLTRIYCVDYAEKESFEKGWDKQDFHLISNIEKSTVSMAYVVDMLMAAVLIVVSICLILIAFLVLRFTIAFTLQEDYKEIGIMKAIGMRDVGIRSVYLIKYLAISVTGAMAGLAFSFPFGDLLLKQVAENIIMNDSHSSVLIPVLCAALIVILVLSFCYGSTGRLKKYSAMDAIRNGSNGESYHRKFPFSLRRTKKMSPALYLAFHNIFSSFKRFAVLAATFCIGTMLILLPLSAANTLKSDGLIELFGLCASDVFLDNGREDQYVAAKGIDMLQKDLREIEETLREHGLDAQAGAEIGYIIPCYAGEEEKVFSYDTLQATGSRQSSYKVLEGREPEAANEIMLTDLTAQEMGVGIGDSLYFKQKEETKEYIITGTYQSMMNLGKGFRVSRAAEIEYDFISGIYCIQVEFSELTSEEACGRMAEIFPNDKVCGASEFLDRFLGSTLEQLDTMMLVITGIVLVINSLITVLTMKSLMTKERGDIALLKSTGFPNGSIRKWQTYRILLLLGVSILAGTLLSHFLAPFVIAPLFAMMGANHIELVRNPLEVYVIYPLLLLAVTGFSAAICAGDTKRVALREVNAME